MNKRITSIVLSFVMLFTILATAVLALAATPVELKVTADTTSANPGDTINYKVSVGAVTNMGGLEFKLDIPSGLTIVDGSISIPTGLETTIDSDGAIVVPTSGNGYKWSYSAQSTGYTGTLDLVILTFSCTVDDGVSGSKDVSINVDTFFDNDHPYPELDYTVTPATVNVTIPHTHVYDQTDTDAAHLKTPATCTAAAVYYKSCTCGENGTETFTSGSALGHDYTKKVENNTYLKTAASNCTEYNVYWYACSRCDANAKDDAAATDKYYTSTTAGNHSFTEKIEDVAHYVAGTGTDCQSVKKYYYDCAYCNQIGTATWDSTTYGPHDYADVWSSDADGHWHECSLCYDKKDKAEHTPGAAATETTPQKCTECDYIITPALGHTHHMTLVDENPATCTADGNTAYYVCSGCSKWFMDAAGNVEITDHSSVVLGKLGHDWVDATCTTPKACSRCDATEGMALGHDYADVWSSDADGHWHECSLCYDKKDKAEHTPGAAATETTPQKCTECDYIITPALGMQDYILEMPVFVSVKLTGDEKPGKETFKLEIYDCGVEDAEFEILNDVLTAEDLEFVDGGAYFYGVLKIKVTGEEQLSNLTEGFKVRMVKGTAKGWTYATEQWYVTPVIFDSTTTSDLSFGYDVRQIIDGEISEIPANNMNFTVGYEAVTEPESDPETTKTGDNSMMVLWIALLVVSGAGVTAIYSRKRKSSAK